MTFGDHDGSALETPNTTTQEELDDPTKPHFIYGNFEGKRYILSIVDNLGRLCLKLRSKLN